MIFISIIIPTYNRYSQLSKTLGSLLQFIGLKNNFEIIVVDNGSTDKTAETVEKFADANKNLDIKYFYDDTPGLLTGRHLGYKQSKGEVICFIDDDVILSKSWLPTIIDLFSNNKNIRLLTGPNLPFFEIYPPYWLNYFWKYHNDTDKTCSWLSLLDFGDKPKKIDPCYVWGLNFIISRKIFEKLGGFHPDNIPPQYQHFQGDGETGLTIKAILNGYDGFYHPGVMLYHQISNERLSVTYFMKRAYYQGVCDSYSQLRGDINLLYNNYSSKKKNFNLKNKLGSLKHDIHIFIKEKVNKKRPVPEDVKSIKIKLEEERKKGFQMHQDAYKNNTKVKEWVHRDNYFDYKLPI